MTTTTPLTSSLAAQYEERVAKAIEQEDAHREETIAQAQRLIVAGDELGFSGDLRRAIHAGRIPLEALAEATQLDVSDLGKFLEGTGELTSPEVAAVVGSLGLVLVQPIPKESRRDTRATTVNAR